MICIGCGSNFGFDTPGVVMKPVSAGISPKSGRAIPTADRFPDGEEEKFICTTCMNSTDLAELLGLFAAGFDFPTEVSDELRTDMYGLPVANLPWAAGYKP